MEQKNISFLNSVKTKLISTMMLITIIPLVIAIIVSYVTSTNKALEDAQDSLEWQAWYVHSSFEKVVDTNFDMIKSIAGNPTIITTCEKTPSDEIGCGMNRTSFSFCISPS